MTRPRKLAAGNWKMNGSRTSLSEVDALTAAVPDPGCEVLICPPATLVAQMALKAGGRISVGGQDCHAAASGAHTGDISAEMLADSGASHVILGHSERRADHGETDADVAAKCAAAWRAGLTPIVCIGETLADRDAGSTLDIVCGQLDASIPEAAADRPLVMAYEPVWAIGTGKVPTTAEIGEVHDALRARLAARFGADVADTIPLLYGGSVKADNAAAIFAVANVDGALVGGASLKAADFAGIVTALGKA